ncbi:efflux RND transporter periplasmic adaptor subunit [Hymenobacter actinosclerus]|uniref:Membrane fusion protein, multidrug efflux system n=1 Tax=Hymenobacter actinosclerus TaxID=82805 RepID=A0A1I0EGJ5_9BACT|nr:efflux RND transporter periplasmic adaptor subunit [Hymenobacter actinosclerus]SET44201.1 membrane fusion protein, multidrug efflux system [Hymenobacter actinosclerus]
MPLPLLSRFRWLLLPLCAASLASCGSDTQADTPQKETRPEILVTALNARDTVLTHAYVADIQAVRNVEVRGRVEGFLEEIYVDEGQTVRKGQTLFRLNDTEYRSRVSQAKAALGSARADARVAELEVERVKMLVGKNIISKTELDVARAKLNAAQAAVQQQLSAQAQANLDLSYTLIKAPFDGVINRIPLKKGSVIEDGTLLTSISDAHDIFAYFNVSEAEYLEYVKTRRQDSARATNVATLILADGSTYPVPGKVETVESQFTPNTGSIAFRARFDNPKLLLRHGATGKVLLTNTVKDAVLVPQKSVFEVQDKNYVYLLGDDGRVMQHSFEPEARLADYYVVKAGLKPGDQVVYEGIQELRDGAIIKPRMVSMKAVLNGQDGR